MRDISNEVLHKKQAEQAQLESRLRLCRRLQNSCAVSPICSTTITKNREQLPDGVNQLSGLLHLKVFYESNSACFQR